MLGMVALMAMTLAGADEGLCARDVDETAVEQMIAAAEARMYEAEIYADAENDFAARLDELGLAGSTLGREEARAGADAREAGEPAVARNR